MSTLAIVNVPVATLWTAPGKARELDAEALTNPQTLNKWLEKLPKLERLDLCDGNRIQSQVLYGEYVLIDEEQDGWAKVCVVHQKSDKDDRGYPGYIPVAQLQEATVQTSERYVIVTAPRAQLWQHGKPTIVVSFNTMLPYVVEDDKHFTVETPHGLQQILKAQSTVTASNAVGNPGTMAQAVQHGLAFLDLPYLWGGMSSYGYDCSGFTYQMARSVGILMSRDADEQAKEGKEVNHLDRSEWQVGDVVFFSDEPGVKPVRHVAFYFGDGQILHSHSTGLPVEILALEGSKLDKEVCAVRRF